jgi:hypothetical protein
MYQRDDADNQEAREQEPDPDIHDRFNHAVPPEHSFIM